jgi:hypothetical protein
VHCIYDDSALYEDSFIASFCTVRMEVMVQQWRSTAFVRGSSHLTSAT